MHGRIAWRGVFITLAVFVVAADDARSEEPSPLEPGSDWWTGLSVDTGIFAHGFVDNQVTSSDLASAPANNPQPLRPPTDDSVDLIIPFVSGSFELVGPGMPTLLGVRPFAHGGIGGEFGVSKDSPKEGATDTFAIADPNTFPGAVFDTGELEQLIRGQGTRLTLETRALHATAGAGLVFTIGTEGRVFHVKPSVEYLWEQVRARGTVQRAVLLQEAPPRPNGLEDYRLVTLKAEETEDFHAIGPGLELEMDLPRQGRFVMSTFVSGRAYYFLGDTKVEFRASNSLGEFADFRFDRDDWSYRVGVGLRLRLEH